MSILKKLQDLTKMIEESTGGRQRLIPNFTDGVDVQTDHDAYTGLLIRQKTDCDTGDITLGFQAAIRRMGSWMSPNELCTVLDEVSDTYYLLSELEQTTITISPDEMQEWVKWLTALRVERAIAQAHEREPQLDSTMGMP